jgi:4-aminobutyrate aminotransferase-like enzyme
MRAPFDQAKTVRQALFEKRILTGTSDDPAFLRLMPPLTLSREQGQLLVQAVASL